MRFSLSLIFPLLYSLDEDEDETSLVFFFNIETKMLFLINKIEWPLAVLALSHSLTTFHALRPLLFRWSYYFSNTWCFFVHFFFNIEKKNLLLI